MSTPPETDFAAQIINAALAFDQPAVPPAPIISPTDKIAELERQVTALKVEKKNAEKRAAERYKHMLHATRHAERTEQALKRETEDKLGSEIKAVKAFHALKEKITDLEHANAQEQRSARTFNQLQELESANNRLRVKLTQEKEAFAGVQQALKQMSSKSQEDKEKFKIQSKDAYDKALAEKQKQWKEESARQLAAAIQKQGQELELTRKENDRLKQQLQKSQQALEWHKVQLQQQSAQCVGVQTLPGTAGIRAGFPLSTQQSPSQVTDQRKRRRLNSTRYTGPAVIRYSQADVNSDASHPTSQQQQDSADAAATPKRRRRPTGNKQLSKNPTTPTRLPQGLDTDSGHTQPVQQTRAEAQEQAILMEARRTGTLQHFRVFMLRAHASRRNDGQSQLNIAQLWQVFSQQLAQEASQQPSTSVSGQDGSQANASGNFAMMQNLPQGGGQFALQSPFPISPTPLIPQARQPFSNHSPLSDVALGFGAADRVQTPQLYQQSPQYNFHDYMQSPAMSNMDYNPTLTLTAGYNANLLAMPLTDVSFNQAILQELQSRGEDFDSSIQSPAQFQDGTLYPSPPGGLQGAQHANETTSPMEIPGWASPTLGQRTDIIDGAAETSLGNVEFQISGNEVASGNFPTATNSSTPFPSFSEQTAAFPQPGYQQEGCSRPTQFESQQKTLDHPSEAHPTNGTTNLAHHSQTQHTAQPTPPQRLRPESPRLNTPHPSSNNAPPRPTIARKQPRTAPPSSAHSSTPASDFPVCLHCHEKWWNETCDAGEPCRNCSASGTACERPRCHLEPGSCNNARCARVHAGDDRFRAVVARPKTLKRKGKMGDRVDSPVVVMGRREGEERGGIVS